MKVLGNKNYFDGVKEGLAIVDVGASWCPDCKRIEPIMLGLEKEYEGKITFFSVDFSKEEELKDTLNIRKIPTLIFYKDGSEIGERLIEPKNPSLIQDTIKSNFGI